MQEEALAVLYAASGSSTGRPLGYILAFAVGGGNKTTTITWLAVIALECPLS